MPEVYKDFRARHPDIARSYDDLALKIHNAGPLDEKTRRLVKLGIAIGLHSEGGIRSHARRALEEGVSAEDVRHVVMLAFTTAGFPTMIAASKWVEEVIENFK
ncbi:MAG: carboxymuconolactone decarboxylase family protein [Chloroflexi bacterium]|nr:carboxymuconolactone decarboxylase family protein [Chloroflexota bacterium]